MHKEESLDQIQQIIESGLFFIQYSKKYRDLYLKKEYNKIEFFESQNRTMIIIQNVLYFEEASLNLQSLFSTDTREACFQSIFNNKENSSIYEEYKTIRKEYFKTPLYKFRNKIIAHKDSKNVGDPITAFFNPIEDEWLDKVAYFYEKLNTFLHDNFDVIENDLFEDHYKGAFDYLYKKLEEDEN